MPTRTIGETTRGVNGPRYALNMSERPPERVIIRGVKPELECGRFPIKRVVGETVAVEADILPAQDSARRDEGRAAAPPRQNTSK